MVAVDCSHIDEERETPCTLRWLAVVLQAMARGSCGIKVMICAYIHVCRYHVYECRATSRSALTLGDAFVQDIQWYDVNHELLERRRRVCVLAKPHLLVTGHHWEELACEELVKYVRERAFDAEVSSCKTTNSCKESVKICDDGGRRSSAYTIDMNRRSIELVITII